MQICFELAISLLNKFVSTQCKQMFILFAISLQNEFALEVFWKFPFRSHFVVHINLSMQTKCKFVLNFTMSLLNKFLSAHFKRICIWFLY